MYKHSDPRAINNTPEGVLVRLKVSICKALGITETEIRMLVDYFVLANFGNKRVGSHYMRVNTYNELSSNRMTVKVFFKFLHIIQIRQIEFNLRVTTRKGAVGEISEVVNFAEGAADRMVYSHKNMDKTDESSEEE